MSEIATSPILIGQDAGILYPSQIISFAHQVSIRVDMRQDSTRRLRNISTRARRVYFGIAVLVGLILLYVLFTSQAGQTLTALCCGGVLLVIGIAVLSERGMRRAQ